MFSQLRFSFQRYTPLQHRILSSPFDLSSCFFLYSNSHSQPFQYQLFLQFAGYTNPFANQKIWPIHFFQAHFRIFEVFILIPYHFYSIGTQVIQSFKSQNTINLTYTSIYLYLAEKKPVIYEVVPCHLSCYYKVVDYIISL